MQDRSISGHRPSRHDTLRRSMLVTASLIIGASIWFMLDDHDSLVAEESPARPSTPEVVAQVAGVEITESELEVVVADELRELEAERQRLLQGAVEGRIHQVLLESAAKAAGTSVEALLAQEVEAKLDQVDPEKLRQALVARKSESADGVSEIELRRELRRESYLAELESRAEVVRFTDLPAG